MLAAMRIAGLLAIVAGCGFHSNAGSSTPIADAPPDLSGSDAGGVLPDAPGPDAMRSEFCAVGGIIGCYEFEGNATDGSGNDLHTAATGVTFVPGRVGMAMQVDGNSSVTVDPSILVNTEAVTIEAWIRPTQLPSFDPPQPANLVDVDQQYAFVLNGDGTLTCDLHPNPGKFSTAKPAGTVAINQWTHVACTYDGNGTARIYIDGSIAATNGKAGTLDKGGHGIGIAQNYPTGQHLVGLIDQLRLLNVARSAAEICTDADRTLGLCLPL